MCVGVCECGCAMRGYVQERDTDSVRVRVRIVCVCASILGKINSSRVLNAGCKISHFTFPFALTPGGHSFLAQSLKQSLSTNLAFSQVTIRGRGTRKGTQNVSKTGKTSNFFHLENYKANNFKFTFVLKEKS